MKIAANAFHYWPQDPAQPPADRGAIKSEKLKGPSTHFIMFSIKSLFFNLR
jgi:hypothetical protein